MTINEYREYNALNYSRLVKFDTNPRTFVNDERSEKESHAMDKGSSTDMLLTDNKKFETEVVKGPNEYAKNTSKILMDLILKEEEVITSKKKLLDKCFELIKEYDLWKGTKDPVKLRKYFWNDDFIIEYKIKKQYIDKIILSVKDYNEVLTLGEHLKEHFLTKDYIGGKKEYDYLYQEPIIFELEGVLYKSLIDILIINHWEKTIQPVDLKTSDDSAFSFKKKVFDPTFRYDIQAGLYSKAVESYRDSIYPDYKVLDFKFVVGSFKYPHLPMVYNAKEVAKVGLYGGKSNSGYKINGVFDIVDNLNWHIKNNLWEYTRDVYENKEILLDSSFVIDTNEEDN